jgi:aminoglycoside phosphotransferase (APT) family kinase protein
VKIHQKMIRGLPSYKDRLEHDIRDTFHLTEDLRRKALALLGQLPTGENICHGDYHPQNVIITKKGPVVIDWMTACVGSRWADVARTSLILSIAPKSAGRQASPILKMLVSFYHRVYLNRYIALVPDSENEVDRWRPVIAAARLNEDILPERDELVKIVNGSLSNVR